MFPRARYVVSCMSALVVCAWCASVCRGFSVANKLPRFLGGNRPMPKWEVIKAFNRHVLHNRGLHGEIVSIESPGHGTVDPASLRDKGVEPVDFGVYQALWYDYAFNQVDPRDEAQFIGIMDMKDASLKQLASREMLNIIQAQSEFIEQYYPQRCKKVFIVNTPSLFGPVFNMVKRVMPTDVQNLIEVIPTDRLTEYVARDQLPRHLGGTSTLPLGHAPEEQGLVERLKYLQHATARKIPAA